MLVNAPQKRERERERERERDRERGERTRIHAEYKTDANERPDVSALFLAMVSQYFMGTLTSA
jgi:hypothetical protein